ncbi:pentatricopeptide repeat-containing protein At5g15280, mitochondrial-like [Salvia splendens]|uniref:pentatricopeptide repeat-containing protein At5g15280, mitochondrial-like n=1 Tax=Salvia splendens TaxID=180675 RepID=UPI001C2706F5|nr:pentatricopeptide repeat-containing protein At5g15280, mitochondrial-like [Salvia splendens]XP_042005246.1 pentatricopeptide repeat-containing protein At5g15280, mitochondrial-like [Salvia splendens]XP_042005247.1 pentatricopeptide repeat-containing protein At5g15280, mitochondrial-like [Salvia splendens]XP_042005248.1 pentatricopeptide repeat-containing protein At5g15280, mitochondrial-like [Salvia splendens]XP_042005249.1 pentatricopeptide repeat-containing protein At5g15280, mitochondrial
MYVVFSRNLSRQPSRRIPPLLTHQRKAHFPTEIDLAHNDLSPQSLSGIAKSAISKCLDIRASNKGDTSTTLLLKDYIFRLSDISPKIVRRFWRVSSLKPQDVLELLVGFECRNEKSEIEVRKVESLWEIFKWASNQSREFEHLPRSCNIMASMLVQPGFYREVENLLSRRECQGFLLDYEEVFSGLIEGYVGAFELDRAVLVYERMRGLGLVPSGASYRALLRYLIEVDAAQLTYHVYDDMINVGIGGSLEEKWIHENLIRRLCVDGKVQEARDLFRKVMSFGMKPSSLIISAIVSGYCDKKDYDDLLSFFADFKVVPDTIHGNKILSSVCRNFGVEEASVFLWDLEELGFHPDEISIGILIGSSCRERRLKNAFFYMSDIVSRGLKPHLYSYNSLLSGLFKEGMWIHARGILVEMKDMGVAPDFSTYKVLVAGFCEARQFDEVKAIVCEMLDHSLVKLSATEDPLAKGFELLGLSPLSVKIRRDNDKGFTKAEFFDKLGNGLYLHTDLDEYERAITQVLDDAMIPDFNSYIMEKLHSLDTENILIMEGEMTRWGQEISLPALSSLFCCLCRAPFNAKVINHHFETMPKSTYLLDESTLNLLVRTNCIMGYTLRARTLFDGMTRRGYKIDNGTYSALLVDACKKGDLASLHFYLNLARKSNWLPEVKDGKAILRHLCKNELLSEALELFEAMVFVSSCDSLDIFDSLLEGLCRQGFTGTACVLIDEFSKQASLSYYHIPYSRIVSGFCQEKRFAEAYKVLETMIPKGLPPPMDALTRLISHLCRTNYENAVELRNMCLRNQTSAQLPFHSAFVNGLCKLGRFEEAARIFMEVKGLVLDAEMCNSSITGYCQRNNLKKIRETLGVMIRKDLSISPSSYSSMVRLICRDGKFSLALSLKELMLRVTCIPELVLYNILIFHISSRRKTLDTVIGALQTRGLQFDDVTFNFVIRGLLLHKDVSHALHYLTTMMRKDLKPTNRTLRGVINSLCHEGELEPALNLSREMELRGWIHGSAIQNDIVEALLSKGRLHEAVGFLDRMVLKGLTPNHIKYDRLIKQFSQYGRVDKAVNLLNVMLQKGSHPEATSYDCLIQGFCNGQKLDAALDFHKEMLCRDLKPSMTTWDTLISALSAGGRVVEAEDLLKSMIQLGETPQREAFNCVINRYRSEKNISKTSELLKVMQQKGYEPDFDTHWSLISNLSHSTKKNGGSFLLNLLSGFSSAGKNNSRTG